MIPCSHCGKEWDTDPVFEVRCPTCGAEPGQKCRRPSGHLVWNQKWPGLPKGAHPKRDIQALKEGKYGPCPIGRCPSSVDELPPDNPFSPHHIEDVSQETTQPSLFD